MLAVSIKDGWVRFIQADIDDSSVVVNQLQEDLLPPALSRPDLRSSNLSRQFQRLFKNIADSLENLDREVYVSLGDEWVESHLLPIDAGLSMKEKEAYLHWVLEQRLGPLWSDAVAFFHVMPDGREDTPTVMAFTTTRFVVEHLKAAIEEVGAVPAWMESTVLSVNRVLSNADEGRTTRAMSIEPHGKMFKAQFLDRGQLRALAHLNLKGGAATDSGAKGDARFASRCVATLNRYLSGEEPDPDLQVHLVGQFPGRYLKMLRGQGPEKGVITPVNPFSKLVTGKGEFPRAVEGSWFVDLLGLIQRRTA
ncbi:MAG: hypothetical protein ACE5GH_04755 [Fidelibacterota bacterium]